ncbi:MAG: FAD-dependent oxidoreductase [Verrucomicrobia bacterium]|nr:FAD-dependent oxidoreductase [Verrucomicrobiota bacterium]MBS0637050.1 FAD-dependent oxidoreductase [Verrucomicrobiota bacterium]
MNDNYYAIVIGAGTAGQVISKGLAKAGKKVLLIDKGPFGGDSTNFGSIPSKTLIASANMAHTLWRAGLYGIDLQIHNFQSTRVMQRVRDVVEQMRTKNDQVAFQTAGVHTRISECHFTDPYTVQTADGEKISAKNIIIATGSHTVIPPIRGLEDIFYRTNESIFALNEIPTSIAIVGGGPTGCEFAQAFRRLGASVFVIEKDETLLPLEEPEVSRAVQSALVKEGVEIYLDTIVTRVRKDGDKITLFLKHTLDDKEYELRVHELLIATGRKPAIGSLNLEAAGIEYSDAGIRRDAYGKTSKSHIWVVGDAAGAPFYTHTADNQANTVLYNLLNPWPMQKKIDRAQPVPRTISCDPEVASIGLTEQQAIEEYGPGNVSTYVVSLKEVDRAICEGETDGFVKFITKRISSEILGATIVAPIAQDMILEVSCAMASGISLRKLGAIIHPYPTYSQAISKASQMCETETFSPFFRNFFTKRLQ